MIESGDVIPAFLQACPGFESRWKEHVAAGESPGVFTDIAEFVHWIVDEYSQGERPVIQSAFAALEKILVEGDADAQGLAVFGFIETLQNVASWEPFGSIAFLPYLGPKSRQAWHEVNQMWEGKTSLADVIRSERSS